MIAKTIFRLDRFRPMPAGSIFSDSAKDFGNCSVWKSLKPLKESLLTPTRPEFGEDSFTPEGGSCYLAAMNEPESPDEGGENSSQRPRTNFEALMAAAKKGDEEAIVQLYEASYRHVTGFLWKRWSRRISQWDRNSVRDFGYRVVDKALADLSEIRSIKSFLCRVAHNAMIDHIRRGSTKIDEASLSLDAPASREDEHETPFHDLIGGNAIASETQRPEELTNETVDERRILQAAIRDELSPVEQTVITMWMAGFSADETGTALGKSSQAIYNTTNRTLKKLHAILCQNLDRGDAR